LRKNNKRNKKPASVIALIASIFVLIIARNIDITQFGDLEFGFKQIIYIIIILLSIASIGYIVKQNDKS
jgi:hypothetical protein